MLGQRLGEECNDCTFELQRHLVVRVLGCVCEVPVRAVVDGNGCVFNIGK